MTSAKRLPSSPAKAVLDDVHQKPESFKKHTKDDNTYVWGSIGEHNVVIASLPIGRYGTVSAASTAWSMMCSLPHLRFTLLVGIGAGIPRLEEGLDIRLGDVVVSQPTDTCPGVVQYDLGRLQHTGRFERVGSLAPPPEILLKALSRLRAEHMMREPHIDQILDQMISRYPKMGESEPNGSSSFVHQQLENDRLFDVLNPSRELDRPARSCLPVVHYGPIASGNSVIKDGVAREKIIQSLRDPCICFEMEAAGLMNNFPCLVVRGICDYADIHKNDRWQNYAAATAAALAKELLQVMDGEDVERAPGMDSFMEQMQQDINTIQATAGDTYLLLQTRRSEIEMTRCYDWLCAPDPSINYNKAQELHHGNTGQWFLDSSEFLKWKSTPQSTFLWVYGKPGCGKTILSSTIIKKLQEDEIQVPSLAYFYIDFRDTSKQSLDSVTRSLICQLCNDNADAREHLSKLYSACKHGTRQPSTEELCSSLSSIIQQLSEVWLVLDALDECSEPRESRQRGLLSNIRNWSQLPQASVHILVTSRPEQFIRSSFNRWVHTENIIHLSEHRLKEDIRAYVHARVRLHDSLSRWQSLPAVQGEIESTLVRNAHGMFRWVSCQLESLEHCFNYPLLQKALTSLPKTLNQTYARILRSVPLESAHYTYRLLLFLTFAERPLRLDEAVDMLAVEIHRRPRFDLKRRIPAPEEISQLCSSLVDVVTREDKQSGAMIKEIQLTHFSVKDYLVSGRLDQEITSSFEEATARGAISDICLAYLLDLDHGLPTQKLKEEFPFAEFSAQYWAINARRAELHFGKISAFTAEFLYSTSAWETCHRLLWSHYPVTHDISSLPASALCHASLNGLTHSVQFLLDRGADPGLQDDAALLVAASRGHSDIVTVLVNSGANINASGGRYQGTALQAASFGGHLETVNILLGKGADVNSPAGKLGSALQAASLQGHSKVVKALVKNGADIDAGGSSLYGTALRIASYKGNISIVRILLDGGADVNAPAGNYDTGTVLQAASFWGHLETARILIKNGSNLNTQGRRSYGIPLLAAIFQGRCEVANFLIEKGADVNVQDQVSLSTPLQLASLKGLSGMVRNLLAKGAGQTMNARSKTYGTALQAARSKGHHDIAQMLVDEGAPSSLDGSD